MCLMCERKNLLVDRSFRSRSTNLAEYTNRTCRGSYTNEPFTNSNISLGLLPPLFEKSLDKILLTVVHARDIVASRELVETRLIVKGARADVFELGHVLLELDLHKVQHKTRSTMDHGGSHRRITLTLSTTTPVPQQT